jgi:hypothetical protein
MGSPPGSMRQAPPFYKPVREVRRAKGETTQAANDRKQNERSMLNTQLSTIEDDQSDTIG